MLGLKLGEKQIFSQVAAHLQTASVLPPEKAYFDVVILPSAAPYSRCLH